MQELTALRHRMDALDAAAAMCQQAEDALRESEMRFRTLVQESLQGILVHRNHQPLFVNQAFAAMFGYATPEEILRLGTVLPLIAPQDRRRMIDYHDARLRGDAAPPQYEFQGLRQDGTSCWVETRATAIQWDGALAIFSTHIDITARHQVEDARARYHLLADQTRDAILFLHRDGRIVDANRAAVAVYGYDRATLLTMTLADLYSPATVPLVAAQLAQAEQGSSRFEAVHRRSDGSTFPIEVSAVRADIGGERLLVHIGRDITERKRAEEALRESEARFRTMADVAPVLIWLADISKRCTYCNTGWLEFTGRTMEQELGYGWAEGVHPDDRPACLETYTTAFEARQPFRLEYRLRRADGEYRWIADHGVPLFAPDGSFNGYVGSGVDITAHKQAEQFLQQGHTELEQRVQECTATLAAANASLHHEMAERQRAEAESRRLECDTLRTQRFALLGHLAASVSHEMRNPLGAIVLQVDLLQEQLQQPTPESPAQIAQSLAEIKTNLARLDDLLLVYLSLVRVGIHQRDVQDLGAAVQAWVAEIQGLAAACGVTVHMEGVERLGLVAFHDGTLRWAVLNLVQNALDAMPTGGTLTLAGQGTATQVQLQVRDTGNGIPANTLPQIFEPLYTTKPRGTGLGLYIVQEIVTAHGGQVTVQSVAGQGTTFTITLPRAAAAIAQPARSAGWAQRRS
jgi:PAS domain S-box-containing protein